MIPLTPVAAVLIGTWIIARALGHVPQSITLAIGIAAVVCGIVDLLNSGWARR